MNANMQAVFNEDDSSQSSANSSPTVSSSSHSTSSDNDDSSSSNSLSSSKKKNIKNGHASAAGGKNFSAMMRNSNTLKLSESQETEKPSKKIRTAIVENESKEHEKLGKNTALNEASLGQAQESVHEDEVVAQILSEESDVDDEDNSGLTSPLKKKGMRIKLSLMNKSNQSKDSNTNNDEKRKSDALPTVEATVISSPVPSTPKSKSKLKSSTSKSNKAVVHRDQSLLATNVYPISALRPIKMPPIASPGLLITNPTNGVNFGSSAQNNGTATNSSSSSNAKKGNTGTASTNSNPDANNRKNPNNMTTPSFVFDNAMEAAGYSTQQRTNNPHRGSSVTRVVGDMFDRDVMVTVDFPSLVPDWMLPSSSIPSENKKKGGEKGIHDSINDRSIDGANREKEEAKEEKELQDKKHKSNSSCLDQQLPTIFMESVSELFQLETDDSVERTSIKDGPMQFIDMLPKSLTTNYSPSYTSKRIVYEEAVAERERIIIEFQKANAKAEDAIMAYEEAKEKWDNKSTNPDSKTSKENIKTSTDNSEGPLEMPQPPPPFTAIEVPPIPRPPTPPKIISCPVSPAQMNSVEISGSHSKLNDLEVKNNEKDYHPISKEKRHLVAHLDPSLFLPTRRYFGLLSNNIADPQFVGPNAPGLTGGGGSGSNHAINGNNGLATAQSSSSNSGGGSSGSYLGFSGMNIAGNGLGLKERGANSSDSGRPTGGSSTGTSKGKKNNPNLSGGMSTSEKKKSGYFNKGKNSSALHPNIVITGTNADLKKAIEVGGEFAENMKISLIKAAIYACETSSEGPWVAFNGETYPDISKAFAMHGGLRPCARCKSNKQGAYHCRLRRKHKEIDYDGRNSVTILESIKGSANPGQDVKEVA